MQQAPANPLPPLPFRPNHKPERLIYLGRNWSGNGYWHQFKKIDDPRPVWCEVLDSDLHMIEETCASSTTQPADGAAVER